LFGHEKGAFTGSTNEKPGAFEMASGGTLFLDEVAEMPTDIQVKLLRALESRMVRRLGGKKEINVDIRVVAATNKDLQKALSDGELRDDLYYRLAVVEIYLPPLRERADDIQLLAKEFLVQQASQNGKNVTGFADEAWDWILSFQWPGNVRELKNAVQRGVIMSRGEKIGTNDMIQRHLRAAPETSALTMPVGSTTVADARRQLILKTFASADGDVSRTAKMAGVSADEVRREILALLDVGGSDNGAVTADAEARIARKNDNIAAARGAAKGKPPKKK
jgi:DNA-binding NtrC family response regulator